MFNKLRVFLGGCDHIWVQIQHYQVSRGQRHIGDEYHRQCTKCKIVKVQKFHL